MLAQFPLPVAMETSDAATIIKTAVVNSAIQRERNCTALRRNGWRHNFICSARTHCSTELFY